jgi:hypothetical protein
MEPLHQPPSLMPTMDSDYETTLRQQQLAVVEQMAMPPVPQSYDPEELFVEFSRLPPNLTDANSFKQFLLPTVPVEIRMAFNGSKSTSFVQHSITLFKIFTCAQYAFLPIKQTLIYLYDAMAKQELSKFHCI